MEERMEIWKMRRIWKDGKGEEEKDEGGGGEGMDGMQCVSRWDWKNRNSIGLQKECETWWFSKFVPSLLMQAKSRAASELHSSSSPEI